MPKTSNWVLFLHITIPFLHPVVHAKKSKNYYQALLLSHLRVAKENMGHNKNEEMQKAIEINQLSLNESDRSNGKHSLSLSLE